MSLLDAQSLMAAGIGRGGISQPIPGPDRIWTPNAQPGLTPYMPVSQVPAQQVIPRYIDPRSPEARAAMLQNPGAPQLTFWQRMMNAFPQLFRRAMGGQPGPQPGGASPNSRPLQPYPAPFKTPKERLEQMYSQPQANFGLPVGTRITG